MTTPEKRRRKIRARIAREPVISAQFEDRQDALRAIVQRSGSDLHPAGRGQRWRTT